MMADRFLGTRAAPVLQSVPLQARHRDSAHVHTKLAVGSRVVMMAGCQTLAAF
jgi:hypothetical protein